MATSLVPSTPDALVWQGTFGSTRSAQVGLATIVEFPACRHTSVAGTPPLYAVDAEGRGDTRCFDDLADAFAEALAADAEAVR